VDGVLYTEHAACAHCTILVGPGHLEQALDADGRCGNCSLPDGERILGWVPPASETGPDDDDLWAA
jgi:hypothetical protein